MIRASNVLISPTDLLAVGFQIIKVDQRTNEKLLKIILDRLYWYTLDIMNINLHPKKI